MQVRLKELIFVSNFSSATSIGHATFIRGPIVIDTPSLFFFSLMGSLLPTLAKSIPLELFMLMQRFDTALF